MSRPQPRQNVLIRKLQFHYEYALFITLNLLVVFMKLLSAKHAGASDDPAQWWYLGKIGYIAASIALMLGVIALCELVARTRRGTARLLLWFGILVLGALAVMTGFNYYRILQQGPGAF